jgi:hypothetical protein
MDSWEYHAVWVCVCVFVCVCVCARARAVLVCPASLLNSTVNIKETLYEHYATGGHSSAVF